MNLTYRIIDMSGHHSDDEVQIVNKCYQQWFEIFNKDLESRGAQLNKDEFQRARVLAVLQLDGQPIGFHLYGVFDIREESSLNHGYFRSLPEATKATIYERGTRSILTLEYLTVFEGHRTLETQGVRMGEVITRLGLKLMEHMGLDAALGVARMDRRVKSIGDHLGAEELALMEKYNNKCSLLYFDRHQHTTLGSPFLLKFIDDLWNSRTDHSTKTGKKAA
jgi:hypothetical protein